MLPSQILPQALTAWCQYDEMYEHFLPLVTLEWPVGPRGDYLESFRSRMIGACEDYTISCRQRLLVDQWDKEFLGIEYVPAEEAHKYNIPAEVALKLNAVGGMHKLPRLWWHLYSRAFVASKLNKFNPLFELNHLVDQVYLPQ